MSGRADLEKAPVRKYSKSSAFYFDTKSSFLSDNDALLAKAEAQNGLYTAQPPRLHCKLCSSPLGAGIDFSQHRVDYKFCPSCGHMNGVHDDTKAFVEALYVEEAGHDYAKNYLDPNFPKRTQDIYIPKVEFLVENIPAGHRTLLDVGCGSGYFVLAALKKGFEATGIDVGRTMVDFGNTQIRLITDITVEPLNACREEDFFGIVRQTSCSVVSAIGVIEHLREPHKLFRAFSESDAEYLYYSVPMFSMSVLFENIFPGIFPRQLAGGHTHLFTESSIAKMNELIGVRPVAEWRFGTDVVDLYRSVLVMLERNHVSTTTLRHLKDGFGGAIDNIQNILDARHFCSEIHLVARKL